MFTGLRLLPMIRLFSLLVLLFFTANSRLLVAQAPLPPAAVLTEGPRSGGIQFSHAFSLRLRPDYCYHSFVLAYDQEIPLSDLRLILHFGSGGSRIAMADLRFANLGGPFVDDRHVTFGYNASCRVDEVRIIQFTATKEGETIGLTSGLALTAPRLMQMTVTQGLPIPESGAGDFRGANLEGEGNIRCVSGGVNLRSGPSTSNSVVAVLQGSASNRIPVTIVSEIEGSNWYQVQTPSGTGYLFGRLLGPC